MASILDEIRAEVETELSQQPQEEKPTSVLEDVKQEVTAEPIIEEPKVDFFESAEKWLEPAPTQKSSGDIFLGLISNKRANELDDEDKGLFNALSDEEQYKVAQARKDIPLDDAQARRIFEVEKSKMPSIPTSWEDWYNLGGDAFDTAKNVLKIGAKVGLGAAEFGRDIVKATDMTVADEEALNNLKKAKSSFYSFMAPAFEIPESVAWATQKAKEGGFGWADAAGEKLGLVTPEDRFENWKGRRLVSQAQAEYFREHPTVYGRMLDNPLAKDALAYIAKFEMESPEELAKRTNISVEEAKTQQDVMAREQIDKLTSQMESELPEENQRIKIAGEFLLPGELGMGTMGFISGVAKAGTGVAKGLKYIGKSADEIAEINKAAQALQKTRFAEMMKKRTERAEAVARGAGRVEKAIEGLKPAAEKVNKALGNITAPVLGGVAGYSVSDESPVTGILSGVIGGVAARGVLKGTKVGLEIPTFVRELAEARKVAPLGKTFETLGKSAEGSALKAKILSRGGKTIDNILSNSVEYARSGIHGTTLALATGALESADPEEMKQMLADGLAITLGGRALQHIKGKMMGNDPIIAQRERISEDSRIHRRYQEADPETQANLDQISDFDNAIAAKQAKLNESESELANLMATYKGSGSDAKNLKLAQSKVEVAKAELDKIKRANIQTRNEFGREFLRTYANLQDITNGVLKTGQNNVGFNILSTDQIYQRLRNDPANNNVPDADLVEIASQAGFYSNPAQEGIVFDRKKPSIVLNADSIRERVRIFGETPIQALVHETGHFMDVVPEFQESLSGVRSMLFQNEIRDAAGNIKATTPGIFSKAKLVELFSDGYLRHLDPQGQEAFAKLNKLWDESRGQLDENKVADYMKREVMADLLGEVSSRHLSKDLDSATLAMWDRARIKAKKNLLDRAINRFYGLGGRGDIVTAANTRAEFTPEAMAAARDAMRQIVALNGEISPPVQEPDMPKISKAQMMKNSALLNRFGKDSPLFKTEFKVKVFDKDGNQIGESMPVTTPNPREGTFQNTDVGMKKLSGYGDIPVEAQGLQVPEGGTLVVSRDLVMQPDGVTPVMYDAKDAKKVAAERRKLITEALDTDDYGTPNRFEPVSEGSETYRGTFTPAQIKAIQDMPESLIPKTLKENMLKMNEAIARGDGTRFIVDYAAVMNDNGKYQAFSPKMYDLVPIGMHLSKAGNFLVTTISVGRIFDKMRLWNERMPGRLRFWDNNLERTFDDFSKYLNNWQQGKAGETGLDADPQIALQKKNIFNDLLSLYDSATEYTNLDRTTIPRRKGDPRGKDPNRTIMSIRVDHIAELLPNENATKLPVNYGFAKINFMPERMEGEVPKQENDKRKNIGISFMPAREEDYAYRGEHKAPDQENGSPLHEVTKTIYPPDFYTLSFDKALQYYGSGDDVSDRESLSAILSAKGKANAKVKVYRAVPKYIGEVDPAKNKEIEDRIEKYSKLVRQNPWSEDFKKQLEQALSERPQQISSINAGDWVTPSRSYAVDHGESALNGEYRILSKSVPASHLFTEGNSLSEFGYNPPAKKGIQFMPERPIEERYPMPERMEGKVSDSEYLDLAKDPEKNREKLQMISDAQAISQGINITYPLFRGVRRNPKDGVMYTQGERATLSFTDVPEVAKLYTHNREFGGITPSPYGSVKKVYLNIKNPLDIRNEGTKVNLGEFIDKYFNWEWKPEDDIFVDNVFSGDDLVRLLNRMSKLEAKTNFESDIQSSDPDGIFRHRNFGEVARSVREILDSSESESETVEQIENILSSIELDTYALADNKWVIKHLKDLGYDGLIHKDTIEAGKEFFQEESVAGKPIEEIKGINAEDDYSHDTWRPFNKEQIKLADPVTYDNEGNVIPLSQRFNPKTPDIRFMPERPIEEERIVAATYTDPRTGEVREGVNHKAANPNAPDEQTDRESRYYGFKTDAGRVVDREEAYRIAEASGQLKEATSEEDRFNADRGVLHSNMVEMEPTIGEKPQSSRMIGGLQFMPSRPVGKTEPLPDFETTIIKGVTPIKGFNWKKATNVEFDIGGGRKMSFSYDPNVLIKPVFKDLIKELKGQPVILLEADRQRATGGDMGGPLHPFLKSNQVTITGPDGKKYKAVWANMTSTFVSGAKNRLASHGAKYALVHLMDDIAHKSNKRTARTLDKMMRDANLNQREKEIVSLAMQAGIIAGEKAAMSAGITALKRQISQAKGNQEKIQIINEKINKIKQERDDITPKGIYGEIFDAISGIKSAHTNVKTGLWKESSIENANKKLENYVKSKEYKELLKNNKSLYISDNIGNTFNDRGSAIGSILSFKFGKFDPSYVMRESSDFKEGKNLEIVTAVELSQNPDIFALYFGNDPKEEAAMSPSERKARDEMRANPDFVEHEAYDWVMLGPENGNNFLVEKPVKPEEIFKKYRETHAGKNVVKGSDETVVGAMRKNAGFILRVDEDTQAVVDSKKKKNK